MKKTILMSGIALLLFSCSGDDDGLPGPGVDPKGGLEFPGHAEPASIDFLYFAYCVGMAAQVSDVVVTSPEMRRVVTVHAICSFFANAVILELRKAD